MKLSAKKRGEIYDAVHSSIIDLRIDLKNNYLTESTMRHFGPESFSKKVDFKIADIEIPLAQKIMKLLDKDYK